MVGDLAAAPEVEHDLAVLFDCSDADYILVLESVR